MECLASDSSVGKIIRQSKRERKDVVDSKRQIYSEKSDQVTANCPFALTKQIEEDPYYRKRPSSKVFIGVSVEHRTQNLTSVVNSEKESILKTASRSDEQHFDAIFSRPSGTLDAVPSQLMHGRDSSRPGGVSSAAVLNVASEEAPVVQSCQRRT